MALFEMRTGILEVPMLERSNHWEPGELIMAVRDAVVEWRDARAHLSSLSYQFERTRKGNEFANQPEMLAAWTRLANAEHALMTVAMDLA
jgi:hypothetical protein